MRDHRRDEDTTTCERCGGTFPSTWECTCQDAAPAAPQGCSTYGYHPKCADYGFHVESPKLCVRCGERVVDPVTDDRPEMCEDCLEDPTAGFPYCLGR